MHACYSEVASSDAAAAAAERPRFLARRSGHVSSFTIMSSHDRKRDPRAEPDLEADPLQVERPFQREVPLSVDTGTPALLPSESQVRAVITPIPFVMREEPHGPAFDPMSLQPAPAPASTLATATASASASESASASGTAPTDDAQPATEVRARSANEGPPLETIEHLLDQGQWQTLHELLGPSARASELSPHLALVFALAHSETHPEDASHSVELAIQSAARAHGLPESSAVVRVIAKRLLRKSPTNWRARPAPPTKISIILVLLALTLGGGGGFWLSTTNARLPIPGLFSP